MENRYRNRLPTPFSGVLPLRVGVSLVACCFSEAVIAQPPKQADQSVVASRPAEAKLLLEQVQGATAAGRGLDQAMAARMLALNSTDAPLADSHLAQSTYCAGVLTPTLLTALKPPEDVTPLAGQLSRSAEQLREQGADKDVIAAQRVYLALFYFKRADWGRLRTTLDEIGDAMTSERVWPWLRGMYWNLRGLAAGEGANYVLALDCHGRALALRKEMNLAADQAESLNNMGYLLFRMGDHAAAKVVLTDACGIYSREREKPGGMQTEGELFARMNLAKAREGAQEFDAALAEYEALIAAARRLPNQARSWFDFQLRNNAAIAHYSLGNFAACERELTQSRAGAIALNLADSLHVAEIDINLGWVALATGRRELAVERFEAAIASLRANYKDHHRYAEGLGYLARAKLAIHAGDEARQLLEEALALREKQLEATLSSALSERDRLAYVQQLRVHPDSPAWPGALDSYLELAPQLSISDIEQYERVLKWKGVLARHDAGDASGGEEARAIEAERVVIRMRLMGLAAAVRRKEPEAVSEASRLEREANDLERKLRALRKAPQAAASDVSVAEVRVSEVAKALPSDAALIDLIDVRRYQARSEGERVGNERVYLAFVVKPDGNVQRVDLAKSSLIDSQVGQLRQRIETRGAFEGVARQLGNLVAKPIREKVGDAAQVIISADGALSHVPWSALPGMQKSYWIEEQGITTVPSATALATKPGRGKTLTGNHWLAVGGVDYGMSKGDKQKWIPLKNTQAEAIQVDRMLTAAFGPPQDAVTVLTGDQAKKDALRELLGKRRWVHLATHGEFQQRRTDTFGVHDALAPLDSVLALAGANTDPTGGAQSLLTAEELSLLDLSGVELMVLSACQTGLGHVQAGQGQVGLVGALNQAGVGTVVASLWKVDDAATSRLMERFYSHALKQGHALKRGEPMAISGGLREAQLELLRGMEHRHPYYWAAWGVTGWPHAGLAP